MTDRMKLIELVTEAYMFGANDSADIYLYVSEHMNATFEDIDSITVELFGPMNLTPAAPVNYLLH